MSCHAPSSGGGRSSRALSVCPGRAGAAEAHRSGTHRWRSSMRTSLVEGASEVVTGRATGQMDCAVLALHAENFGRSQGDRTGRGSGGSAAARVRWAITEACRHRGCCVAAATRRIPPLREGGIVGRHVPKEGALTPWEPFLQRLSRSWDVEQGRVRRPELSQRAGLTEQGRAKSVSYDLSARMIATREKPPRTRKCRR